jgi:hypothetical protein
MLRALLCILSIISFPLAAETIGNVEYNIPKDANWEIGNKIENDKGVTIIYLPKGVPQQATQEFFGVNLNSTPSDVQDIGSLEAALKKQYPTAETEFKILDHNPQSAMYEWSVKQNGVEGIHGWARAFSSPSGTVILSYQTRNPQDVERARQLWLPVLKNAKIVNKEEKKS